MSQGSSESKIWDYKPLKKTKKRSCKSQITREDGTKRRKDGNPGTSVLQTSVSSAARHTALDHNGNNVPNNTVNSGSLDVNHGPLPQDVQDKDPQSGGYCPVCQMPFSLLVVQSQQWHVAECLDNPGDNCKGNVFHKCIWKVNSHSVVYHTRFNSSVHYRVPTYMEISGIVYCYLPSWKRHVHLLYIEFTCAFLFIYYMPL